MSNYSVEVSLSARDKNLVSTLQGVDKELDQIEEKGGGANESIFDMKDALLATAAAGAILKGIEIAGELNAAGAASNAAERTFNQLSGGVEQATANLEMMREATRGSVADTLLQENANQLLMMNLAKTGDEAARLTGMSVALGRAMGTDAATAASDFASMLANQSIPRLDTFGISSAAVRQRIEELKKSGMGMEEAFSTAVFEEGDKALARLGNTIDESSTNADKFNTNITNLRDNIGQGINVAVNFVAGELNNIVFGETDAYQQAAEEAAKTFVDTNMDMIAYYYAGYEGKSADAFKEYMTEEVSVVYKMLQDDPELASNRQKLYEKLTEFDMPANQKDPFIDAVIGSKGLFDAEKAIKATNDAAVKAAQDQARNIVMGFVDTMQSKAGVLADAAGLLDILNPGETQLWKQKQIDIAAATDELNTFTNAYGDMWPVIDINNQTDTGTLSMLFTDATEELAHLQELSDKGLISDADLEKAAGIANNLQTISTRIQGIQDMSLDGLLGRQAGDGSLTQIQGTILDEAAKSGMSDTAIAAMKQSFGLASGQETTSGLKFEDEVAPVILDIGKQLGEEAMNTAIANVNAYLEQAANLGLTDAQKAAGLEGATGFTQTGASGAKFQINAGESAGAAAARLGTTVDQLLANTGSKDARSIRAGSYNMPGSYEQVANFDASALANSVIDDTVVQAVQSVTDNTQTMGENVGTVSNGFLEVNTQAATLQGVIADITAKVHKVTVELDIKNLDVLNSALTAIGSGTSVQNNGGRVPSKDPRAD